MPCARSIVLHAMLLAACATSERPATSPVASAVEVTAPAVGDSAPPIAIKGIDGRPLSLTPGKVTLIVFWATWSEPDKRGLIDLQKFYAPAKFAVIALSIDDEPSGLAEFAKTY